MGKAFEKGDPRINRAGRPRRGTAMTDILNLALDREDGDGKMRREAVAEKLIAMALDGDMAAIRYLMDRVDGKPKESVELSGGATDVRLREILENGR